MKHQYILIISLAIALSACGSPSAELEQNSNDSPRELGVETDQGSSPPSQLQSKNNPILGTWKLVPGQRGGEYWPESCREIRFEERASYCGDTGSPNSYDVQGNQVTVYDDRFEQIARFPDSNTMTVDVMGVGTLEFKRTE